MLRMVAVDIIVLLKYIQQLDYKRPHFMGPNNHDYRTFS